MKKNHIIGLVVVLFILALGYITAIYRDNNRKWQLHTKNGKIAYNYQDSCFKSIDPLKRSKYCDSFSIYYMKSVSEEDSILKEE